MFRKNLLILPWFLTSLVLLVYSFTQVDLVMTFIKAGFWQPIQHSLQKVGFLEHMLAIQIYIGILVAFYALYLLTLHLIRKHKISRTVLRRIIFVVAAVLFFSYNAFSYDMFNYIFDAKIVTNYHANPYTHRGLDYPQDPMRLYMRYVERTYPYGPGWLAVTVPLSFIGLQYFIITFYLFKLLMLLSYLGSIFLIEKIARKTKVIDPLFAVAFFALNPLVIIECLVSSHNDIVMIFFVLLALYYVVYEKYKRSILFYLVSVSIKFATVFAFPIFFYHFFKKKQTQYFDFLVVIMITAVILASLRINYQPWYLMYLLPFISFRATSYYFFIPTVIITFGSLLIYAVYIYFHNVDPSTATLMGDVQNYTFLIALLVLNLYIFFFHKKSWYRKDLPADVIK